MGNVKTNQNSVKNSNFKDRCFLSLNFLNSESLSPADHLTPGKCPWHSNPAIIGPLITGWQQNSGEHLDQERGKRVLFSSHFFLDFFHIYNYLQLYRKEMTHGENCLWPFFSFLTPIGLFLQFCPNLGGLLHRKAAAIHSPGHRRALCGPASSQLMRSRMRRWSWRWTRRGGGPGVLFFSGFGNDWHPDINYREMVCLGD